MAQNKSVHTNQTIPLAVGRKSENDKQSCEDYEEEEEESYPLLNETDFGGICGPHDKSTKLRPR